MEIHQIRCFVALCQTLNFTRAAVECGITQPTLTRSIQKLEEELGGPLFRRERGLTHLTDLGRLVRPHLEAVYNSTELARQEAKSWSRAERAPLRLGIMCTIGPARLVPFMKRLKLELPAVDLTLKDAPGRDLVPLLLEGELDGAILALPNLPERFDRLPLYRERYTIAFHPGHRFEAMNEVPYDALEREDYLSRLNCEYPEHFDALGQPDTVTVNVRFASEREDWVQAMILAGLGCAVMPEFLPLLPGIATRPIVRPEISRHVHMVSVAGRRHSPALASLLGLVRRHPWEG
mgnify:CR=1 FL=1